MTYAGIDTTVTVMNAVSILKIGWNDQTSESELEQWTAVVPNSSFITRPTFRWYVTWLFENLPFFLGIPFIHVFSKHFWVCGF